MSKHFQDTTAGAAMARASSGEHWIEIIGGHRYVFGRPNDIGLTAEQLAKALSQINRYTGHTDARLPYSVAQHSVFVSELLDIDPEWAMGGLLHDAPEIVIGDVSSPLKWYLGKENLAPLVAEENRAYATILKALGLKLTLPVLAEQAIKHADLVALVTEKRDLLSASVEWGNFKEIPAHPRRIVPQSPPVAARRFVKRFNDLKKRLGQCRSHNANG